MSKTSAEIKSVLQSIGRGILKFLRIILDFILEALKVSAGFLKGVAWIILAASALIVAATFLAYVVLNTIGIKDSPKFQEYRENIMGELLTKDQPNVVPIELKD